MIKGTYIPKKYRPGNPMRDNLTAMGVSVGNNVEILFYSHDMQRRLEIVDTTTGDVLVVDITPNMVFKNVRAENQAILKTIKQSPVKKWRDILA